MLRRVLQNWANKARKNASAATQQEILQSVLQCGAKMARKNAPAATQKEIRQSVLQRWANMARKKNSCGHTERNAPQGVATFYENGWKQKAPAATLNGILLSVSQR